MNTYPPTQKYLEWRVNLCEANKNMIGLPKTELERIVDTYSLSTRVADFLWSRTSYAAAEYNMACRFLKKYERQERKLSLSQI